MDPVFGLLGGLTVGLILGVFQESRIKPIFDKLLHLGHKHTTQFLASQIGMMVTVKITILAAYKLKNVDSGIAGDVSDPYCEVWNPRTGKKQCTKTIHNNLNPVWTSNNVFEVIMDKADANDKNNILITVRDSGILRNKGLGQIKISVADLEEMSTAASQRQRRALDDGAGAEIEFSLIVSPYNPQNKAD